MVVGAVVATAAAAVFGGGASGVHAAVPTAAKAAATKETRANDGRKIFNNALMAGSLAGTLGIGRNVGLLATNCKGDLFL